MPYEDYEPVNPPIPVEIFVGTLINSHNDSRSMGWEDDLRRICKEMKQGGVERKVLEQLSIPGSIELSRLAPCDVCRYTGIYTAMNYDAGGLFHMLGATYCPQCEFTSGWGQTVAEWMGPGFLPVMKQRLIHLPGLLKEVKKDGECPVCKRPQYVCEMDLGSTEYWDHTWKVCINPSCAWPGDHHDERNYT